MRKNSGRVLLILTTLVVVVLTAFPKTVGLPLDTKPTENPADILALLREAAAAGREDPLLSLSLREDAIGFAANLALADLLWDREAEGISFLRRALELHESKDLRFRLAEGLKGKGDTAAAAMEYLTLLPDSRAIDALQSIHTDREVILSALAEGGYWQAVVDFLNTFPTEAFTDRDEIYLAQAMVQLDDFDRARPLLKELAVQFPEDQTVMWHYARTLEAIEKTEEAIILYNDLGSRGAQRLGQLYEQDDKRELAAAAYARSTDPAVIWRGAVLWDELGEHQRALALYRKLTHEPGPYRDDAMYRSYLLLVEAGSPEAQDYLGELSARPSWMVRLNMEPSWPLLTALESDESMLLMRLDAYRQAGRDDLVNVELSIAWQSAAPQDKISLGNWYSDRSDFRQAARWGVGALKEITAREAYELAYPRPFFEEVGQAAAEFDLEPELIWAVMREESRFQPAVVSWAGAIGLMQIMPATGEEIAAKLDERFSEDLLTQPSVNIRWGAYYLRSMLNLYGDDLDKALAAYNGGPGNVRRWHKSELGKTSSGFPTAITFFETREYITKVTDSYLTYLWLYGDQR
ncbi:MAG: lytic transglycosylase domain-containing protein [Bacillota bacterium]|nr:lytic transglycosylase domain-containing protein [Bacillota bacterium]MDW7683847.1 lytic transglycosylase domain-containing protein [Bacillota bacterium]